MDSNLNLLANLSKKEYNNFLEIIRKIEKQRVAYIISTGLRNVLVTVLVCSFCIFAFKIFQQDESQVYMSTKLALLVLLLVPYGVIFAWIIENYKKTRLKQQEEKVALLRILLSSFMDTKNFHLVSNIKNDNPSAGNTKVLQGSTQPAIIPLVYLSILVGVILVIMALVAVLSSLHPNYSEFASSNRNYDGIGYAIVFITGMYSLSKFKHNISMLPSNKFNIFNTHGMIDDYFKGEYHGIQIDIQELVFLNLERMLLISFPQPKPTKATIITKSRNYGFVQSLPQKVSLEDSEFNKLFETSTTDQIEARYIITPSFMERIKEIQKKGHTIACNFQNGYVYIAINSNNKDLFEFHGQKSLLQKSTIVLPILQLKEYLSLIDTLKMDEKIGL